MKVQIFLYNGKYIFLLNGEGTHRDKRGVFLY